MKLIVSEMVKTRIGLLQSNVNDAEVAYERALDDGVEDPVVFLLDIRDPQVAVLAEAYVREKGKVRQAIDDCVAKEAIPIAIVALPHGNAVKFMDAVFQGDGGAWPTTIPCGCFRIVVIAFGGYTHRTHPEPVKSWWKLSLPGLPAHDRERPSRD